MTLSERNESIEYIKKQLDNGYVDVGGVHEENEIQIIQEAISALLRINQIRWERDVAISQLEDLGISLGQRFGCEHCRFKRMSGKNLWCDIFDKIMPEDGYCCFFEFDNVKQEGENGN